MGLLASAVIWFTLLNDINSTLRYEYYRKSVYIDSLHISYADIFISQAKTAGA